jgi:hypothetical protein
MKKLNYLNPTIFSHENILSVGRASVFLLSTKNRNCPKARARASFVPLFVLLLSCSELNPTVQANFYKKNPGFSRIMVELMLKYFPDDSIELTLNDLDLSQLFERLRVEVESLEFSNLNSESLANPGVFLQSDIESLHFSNLGSIDPMGTNSYFFLGYKKELLEILETLICTANSKNPDALPELLADLLFIANDLFALSVLQWSVVSKSLDRKENSLGVKTERSLFLDFLCTSPPIKHGDREYSTEDLNTLFGSQKASNLWMFLFVTVKLQDMVSQGPIAAIKKA